jgi:hypothetical protein
MSVSYFFAIDTAMTTLELLRHAIVGSSVSLIGDVETQYTLGGEEYYLGGTNLYSVGAHSYPLTGQRRQYPYLGALPMRPTATLVFNPDKAQDHDTTVARIVAGLMSVVRRDQGDFVLQRDDYVLMYRLSGQTLLARPDPGAPWLLGPRSRAAVDIDYTLGDMPLV